MRKTLTGLFIGLGLAACGADDKAPAQAPPPPTTAPAATVALAPPLPSAAPPVVEAPKKKTLAELQADTNAARLEASNHHDAKKLAQVFAEDGILTVFGNGDFKGRDAIAEEETRIFTSYPDLKIAFGRTWTKGKTEVVEWTITGTNSGDMGPMKATNKSVGITGASVYTFNDEGLITSEHRYWDPGTAMAQLGLSKAPARAASALPLTTEAHVAKGTPDEDKSVESIKAMYASMEGKKEADFLSVVTDTTVFDDNVAPAAMKGKKDAESFFKMYTKGFPDGKTTVATALGVEDFVIAEFTFAGTRVGAMPGIKPAAKPFTVHGVDIMQVKDGKLVHGWTYQSSKELLEQIGQWKAGEVAAKADAKGAPAMKGDTKAPPAAKADAKPAKGEAKPEAKPAK